MMGNFESSKCPTPTIKCSNSQRYYDRRIETKQWLLKLEYWYSSYLCIFNLISRFIRFVKTFAISIS